MKRLTRAPSRQQQQASGKRRWAEIWKPWPGAMRRMQALPAVKSAPLLCRAGLGPMSTASRPPGAGRAGGRVWRGVSG